MDTFVIPNENVVAVTIYTNADIQKELVIKENKGKSGIYRLINKQTLYYWWNEI